MNTLWLTDQQFHVIYKWACEGLDYRSYWAEEDCDNDPESLTELQQHIDEGRRVLEQLSAQAARWLR